MILYVPVTILMFRMTILVHKSGRITSAPNAAPALRALRSVLILVFSDPRAER